MISPMSFDLGGVSVTVTHCRTFVMVVGESGIQKSPIRFNQLKIFKFKVFWNFHLKPTIIILMLWASWLFLSLWRTFCCPVKLEFQNFFCWLPTHLFAGSSGLVSWLFQTYIAVAAKKLWRPPTLRCGENFIYFAMVCQHFKFEFTSRINY